MPSSRPLPERLDTLVIGAGMSGIAMGYHLKKRGLDDFIIAEKSDGFGGVWRDNRYPGAGCDVPSHLYSFSFALKPDWSRKYALQAEILDYFEACAERFGLGPHLRTGLIVRSLTFDESEGRWQVRFADGSQTSARVVISAVGQLSEPFTPDIAGLSGFAGPVMHTACWDSSVKLDGQRVALIGNAASAIQLLPEVSERARELTVFQRTPNWIISKPDRAFTSLEKWAFANIPGWQRLYRLGSFLIHELRYSALVRGSLASRFTRWTGKRKIAKGIKDPELRAKLTPDYAPGCKRILLSNDYFAVMQRENVRLVTDGIARVLPDGVETATGETIASDTLVLATGFVTTEFLPTLEVTGADGRSLRDVWGASPHAYKGVAVAGFPNLFMLYGPNTNLGHNSIIFMVERQAEYIADKVGLILDGGLKTLAVRPEAESRYNADLQTRLSKTVWAGDCPSWYKTADGVITQNWEGLATRFARTLGTRDDGDWEGV
ncbi:flavin-containing monooxygenase [Glycocaulis sp.]|uniref:flavin-containing monooxygenase n=1 Tax=Glycocaulis sp. TaxID=1969725 RepID=UPI003F6F9BCD